MAERPCWLWRDTSDNHIYKVAWDRCTKVYLGTAAGADKVTVEQYFLDPLGTTGWSDISLANSTQLRNWLNSIPTIV